MPKPYTGVEIDIIESVAKLWNFSYDIIDTNDIFGEQLDNGSWTGIIGQVFTKVSMNKSNINEFIIYNMWT